MKITGLSRTKNKKRINIEVDEEFAIAIEEGTLIKFNLFVDQQVTKEKLREIKRLDIEEYGFRKSLDFLSRRLRSEKEIFDYLNRRIELEDEDLKNEFINNIIARLEENKYIDDKEFAHFLITSRVKSGKKSRKEIEKDLIKFAIDKDIYEELLKKEYTQAKEIEIIKHLVQKRLSNKSEKQKIIEYLLRKGFPWDLVKRSLNE